MKIKVQKSLDKGLYDVLLTGIKQVEVDNQDGYIEVAFDVPTEKGVKKGKMNVFGTKDETTQVVDYTWPLTQLVDKAGLDEIEDTEELVGQKVQLYYSHSYYDKKDKVTIQRKQWNFYEPNSPKAQTAPTS